MKSWCSIMIWHCKYIVGFYVSGRIACSRFVWGYLPCVFNCLILALLITCAHRPGLLWAWLLCCQHSWARSLPWWEVLLPWDFPFDSISPGFLGALQCAPCACGHGLGVVWKPWSRLVCAQVPSPVCGAQLVCCEQDWECTEQLLGCAHPTPPKLGVQGSSATAQAHFPHSAGEWISLEHLELF